MRRSFFVQLHHFIILTLIKIWLNSIWHATWFHCKMSIQAEYLTNFSEVFLYMAIILCKLKRTFETNFKWCTKTLNQSRWLTLRSLVLLGLPKYFQTNTTTKYLVDIGNYINTSVEFWSYNSSDRLKTGRYPMLKQTRNWWCHTLYSTIYHALLDDILFTSGTNTTDQLFSDCESHQQPCIKVIIL